MRRKPCQQLNPFDAFAYKAACEKTHWNSK